MKLFPVHLFILLLAFASCKEKHQTIQLTYDQHDIQKAFDTLYNYQQSRLPVNGDSVSLYNGFTEQALAHCHREKDSSVITQDVLSSMYLNNQTSQYDCVTVTTFQFTDGTITANGIFNLVPGDTIAPDHDFPITGGSGAYRNLYGTYTRKYSNGTYTVTLDYVVRP